MRAEIHVHEDKHALAKKVAEDFLNAVNEAGQQNRRFSVALSGGSTPKVLFQVLAEAPFKNQVKWHKVQLFWGDERSVTPDHEDSNFGMTKFILLDKVDIPEQNIHRIHGEASAEYEANRYTEVIQQGLPASATGFPQIDWVLLGMGDDGHTASLFPNAPTLDYQQYLCTAAVHPVTNQIRISFTLPLINSAKRISFLVTGSGKAKMVKRVLEDGETGKHIPASLVSPTSGILEWHLDKKAASLIRKG